MGKYVTKKGEMKFQSQDALKTVQAVIDDADRALQDKSRGLKDSPIGEALARTLAIGVVGRMGFVGLYREKAIVGLGAAVGVASGLASTGGLIGGGIVAGIATVAAPVVIMGGVGMGTASYIKNKKLREAKELVYKNATEKQRAVLRALQEETDADKERRDYIKGLNLLLQEAIKDLQYDLGI